MTNEEIVSEIRRGKHVKENYELLYSQNLPIIKQWCKPYSSIVELEDLEQEAYFGVVEAVNHYESAENVKFLTYCKFWVQASCRRYITNHAYSVRIPSEVRQQVLKYKKVVAELNKQGINPTKKIVAEKMNLEVARIEELEKYSQPIVSLDTPIADDDSLTMIDTLIDDSSLENDSVDRIYHNELKDEIWGVVDEFTSIREAGVLYDYYGNGYSLKTISKERGISAERARQIKESGLAKLRRTQEARDRLLESLDVLDASIYRCSLSNFKARGSRVEYIAIKRVEAKNEYVKQIDELYASIVAKAKQAGVI